MLSGEKQLFCLWLLFVKQLTSSQKVYFKRKEADYYRVIHSSSINWLPFIESKVWSQSSNKAATKKQVLFILGPEVVINCLQIILTSFTWANGWISPCMSPSNCPRKLLTLATALVVIQQDIKSPLDCPQARHIWHYDTCSESAQAWGGDTGKYLLWYY